MGENIELHKLQLEGKTVYIVGGLHFPGMLGIKNRQKISQFLSDSEMSRKNTVVLNEGMQSLFPRHDFTNFVIGGTSPLRFFAYPIVSADTVDTYRVAMHIVNRRIKWIISHFENINTLTEEKRDSTKEMFRNFLYATAVREMCKGPGGPKNVILFQGKAHASQTNRFLANPATYERYLRHLQNLAPVASRTYERHLNYLTRKRKKIQKRVVKK